MRHAPGCDGKHHDGCKPDPACVRSYFNAVCAHHPGERGERVKLQLCARQHCESSTETNSIERQRDAWDGTAAVPTVPYVVPGTYSNWERIGDTAPFTGLLDGFGGEVFYRTGKQKRRRNWAGKWRHSSAWHARARGVRHFGDEVPLAILEFTTPAELRDQVVGERLWMFRRAAAELGLRVMRRHVGNERAQFWVRSWFHPEGDEEPGVYKPHENVVIPLAWWDPIEKRGHRVGRFTLPKSWMGAGGWIEQEWHRALRAIFGRLRPGAENWHYHWKTVAQEKAHALKYFGRTFASWAQQKDVRPYARPRSMGLAHWKRRRGFSRLLQTLNPLPPHDACPECIGEGVPVDELPPRIPLTGATVEEVERKIDDAVARHSCPLCQGRGDGVAWDPYPEKRRTMLGMVGSQAPPRAQGPPEMWLDPSNAQVLTQLAGPRGSAPWEGCVPFSSWLHAEGEK